MKEYLTLWWKDLKTRIAMARKQKDRCATCGTRLMLVPVGAWFLCTECLQEERRG